jgi:parallel beta-helix repeat protein
MKALGPIGVLLACCCPLSAAIINVTNVPSLTTAIQNENASAGGDTIVLAAGTYNITSPIGTTDPSIALALLKPMTLQSAGGASTVTINCNGVANGILIVSGGIVIDGFTVTNTKQGFGVGDYMSAGQVITGVVLRNLIITTLSTSDSTFGISTSYMNNSLIELCTITYGQFHGISLAHSSQNLIINNTVSQTGTGDGIALVDSDHNTITGNMIGGASTNIAFDGVALQGAQYNYVGFNTILNPHNGVTLTLDTNDNRRCIRNWVGNNHIVMRDAAGSDGIWFNDNSNYNMAFGNDATGAQENGFALYSSIGNYLEGNVFFANPQGGIYVNGSSSSDPGCSPNCVAADFNSIQQNYLYNHPANGGVTTSLSINDDVGFNFIAGNISQISQPIAGLLIQGSSGEKLYSNVIQNLDEGEYISAATTSGSLYLNRHFNATIHYSFSPTGMQWDSGSTVLGGNYYSDFTTANGNPSNGSTPYTNIIDNTSGGRGAYEDRYPYESESLGKTYGVLAQLPAAGASLAAGTFKTISWISQGCVFVDLTLYNSSNSATPIVSNYPDYGFYRWSVPAVTPGAYTVTVTCKNSLSNATGASASTPAFNITTSDLVLLSPQRNLMVNSGAAIQIAWSKSSNVTAGVDVYIRYSDSQAYALLQSGVTADSVTLTPSVPAPSNRVNVKVVFGAFADSTDGWFSIRSTTNGQFTSPAAAGSSLYVGTPYPLEWISPTGTDYVNISLLGGATTAIATQLADFGKYLALIPDVQGSSMTFNLTFYNSSGTDLGTATSLASAIVPGGGFSACTPAGTATIANVRSEISQALGTAAPTSDKNSDGKVNVVDVQILIDAVVGCGQ